MPISDMAAAVKRAFAPPKAAPVVSRPKSLKQGLDVLFHVRMAEGDGLFDCAVRLMRDGALIAAAGVNGSVTFVDGTDGTVSVRCDAVHDGPPNVLVFASDTLLVLCGDDGCIRCVAVTGEVVHTHRVAAPCEDGKRERPAAPIDHAIMLDGGVCVAAAGRLVHACKLPVGQLSNRLHPDGQPMHALELSHALDAAAPVRALCAAPPAQRGAWAYALATAPGVRLISEAGDTVRQLSSLRMLRSLGAAGSWVAAAAMDGALELWETVTPRMANVHVPFHTFNAACGTDGTILDWRFDGGALVLSGRRASVFDFSGAFPPHPYRKPGCVQAKGQPDSVPRVCMSDEGVRHVRWAPPKTAPERPSELDAVLGAPPPQLPPPPPPPPPPSDLASDLATVDVQGTVRLWCPHGLPLRKGGMGNAHNPQSMKPQFYTYVRQDATHPSGDAVEACALLWLAADAVAVGYFTGEIVAWRVAR